MELKRKKKRKAFPAILTLTPLPTQIFRNQDENWTMRLFVPWHGLAHFPMLSGSSDQSRLRHRKLDEFSENVQGGMITCYYLSPSTRDVSHLPMRPSGPEFRSVAKDYRYEGHGGLERSL